jgi:hypothetical protein
MGTNIKGYLQDAIRSFLLFRGGSVDNDSVCDKCKEGKIQDDSWGSVGGFLGISI